MISTLLRLPLDCLETRLLLDMSEQQYALSLDGNLIPHSQVDREFAPHLLKFHNFWDLLQYRLSVVLESAIDKDSIKGIVAILAQEIDVLDRNGHPIDKSLCQIVSDHFFQTADFLSSYNNPFFGHSLRFQHIIEIIVGEFRSLFNRMEVYFEQRISEGNKGKMEYPPKLRILSKTFAADANAQMDRVSSGPRS